MATYTKHFHALLRGVASRRRTFILSPGSRSLIYPPRGKIWYATRNEEARCDAFILFFVSELEDYLEAIIDVGIKSYEDMYAIHVIKNCRASSEYLREIQKKKGDLAKNNNANWSRISHFFEFIGMKKEIHFPLDFWDDIETIVKHRGDVAHNGAILTIMEDRRNVINKIELTLVKLRRFDEQFNSWINQMHKELRRLNRVSLAFAPSY
jgi:hypothetical protein